MSHDVLRTAEEYFEGLRSEVERGVSPAALEEIGYDLTPEVVVRAAAVFADPARSRVEAILQDLHTGQDGASTGQNGYMERYLASRN